MSSVVSGHHFSIAVGTIGVKARISGDLVFCLRLLCLARGLSGISEALATFLQLPNNIVKDERKDSTRSWHTCVAVTLPGLSAALPESGASPKVTDRVARSAEKLSGT